MAVPNWEMQGNYLFYCGFICQNVLFNLGNGGVGWWSLIKLTDFIISLLFNPSKTISTFLHFSRQLRQPVEQKCLARGIAENGGCRLLIEFVVGGQEEGRDAAI